jgi:hypothetical protein
MEQRCMGTEAVTDEEREECYVAVRAAIAGIDVLRPGSVETATFLLDEAKSTYEQARIRSGALEAKATMLLGVVVGASSALGILGIARDGKPVVVTPLIGGVLVCAVIAILCLLYVLRVKPLNGPDLAGYASSAMVEEDNRLGLAIVLAAFYIQTAGGLLRDIRAEPRAWFISCTATALAALLVVINTLTHNSVLIHSPPATARSRSVLYPSSKAPILTAATRQPRGKPSRGATR